MFLMGEVPLYQPFTDTNTAARETEFLIDNPLVRILFIIVMIRWTGLAPREFEFPFPGSLTSTFLAAMHWPTRKQAGGTTGVHVPCS